MLCGKGWAGGIMKGINNAVVKETERKITEWNVN